MLDPELQTVELSPGHSSRENVFPLAQGRRAVRLTIAHWDARSRAGGTERSGASGNVGMYAVNVEVIDVANGGVSGESDASSQDSDWVPV